MFVRDLKSCDEFVAGDKTILRELLHPDKTDLAVRYSLAHATLRAGETSTPHTLKTAEVYYILEGKGIMWIDDESAAVYAGQVVYIPPHAVQHISNVGETDVQFLCIVDPAWRIEDEEVLSQ